MDELIFILLSAKTAESSYLRTYHALRTTYKDWFEILNETPGNIARIIAGGGLSQKKAIQIQRLLNEIRGHTNHHSLAFLEDLTTLEAEEFLTSLPGVGLKTARCVLMYAMRRDVFPVDTHVRRVLSRLGLIQFRRLTYAEQDSIQSKMPIDIRYKLHVNLVAHGRATCKAHKPLCSSCVVNDMCRYYADSRGIKGTKQAKNI